MDDAVEIGVLQFAGCAGDMKMCNANARTNKSNSDNSPDT